MAAPAWTADKIAALLGEHPNFPKKVRHAPVRSRSALPVTPTPWS